MFSLKRQPAADPYAKYVDPTGELPNRELDAARWYVTHKALLQKIGMGALVAWCVVTVGYGVVGWTLYGVFGYWRDRESLTQLRQSFSTAPPASRNPAAALEVEDARVFTSAEGKYDMYAPAKNANPRMIAVVSFHYAFAGGTSPSEEHTILPGLSSPLVIYGVSAGRAPEGVALVVDRVIWQRVDPHTVPNPAGFIAARLQFATEGVSFHPAFSSGVPVGQVSFDIVNAGAYGYWQAPFIVEFLDGDAVTGVGYLVLDRFVAGERRRITFGALPAAVQASDVRLSSRLNVFDSSVYMPPGM